MCVFRCILIFMFLIWNGCLADKTHFSKWIKTDSDYSAKTFIFETILSQGIGHCVESCKAKKMCEYINFNVDADACFLIGVRNSQESSESSPDDRIEKKKGYILGKKKDWNLETYKVCSECEPHGVCRKNDQPADKYSICKSSGCGPPENKQFTLVRGNMFSIGNKIKYYCLDGYTDVSGGTGIAECQETGAWSSTDIKCVPDGAATTCNGNSCYLQDETLRKWQDGKIYCENLGGHLAYIKTEPEHDFVKKNMSSTDTVSTWLGANDGDKDGTYIWTDGTPVDKPSFWGNGEPNFIKNENCLVYHNLELHNAQCSKKFTILCEFKIHRG
ncbi:versican core protein-like [Mercenaria mercenaria]|uniref:versican core protein-like n=1 Tax=Mercenaria mercenaria TaxID=6596 RepID=UPI00234EEF3C|nr:versican core protein-like [Mercenaria mercenaria]